MGDVSAEETNSLSNPELSNTDLSTPDLSSLLDALDDSGDTAEPRARRAKRRRVRTDAPVGSDPHPTGEPQRHQANENDERLKSDKPPHWG